MNPRHSLANIATACGILTLLALPASASLIAAKWWDGDWNCSIDGRSARMKWKVVDDTQTTCSDGICTSTAKVKRVGQFSDNGGGWVALTFLREDLSGGLNFQHADGNAWYLPKPKAGRSTGWTTWQGRRYPLICWRSPLPGRLTPIQPIRLNE